MHTIEFSRPSSRNGAETLGDVSPDGVARDCAPTDSSPPPESRSTAGAAEVDVSRCGRLTIVTIGGTLDASARPLLVRTLQSIIACEYDFVIVDMLGVDFIGTQCIESMLDFSVLTSTHDVGWTLCARRSVRRPLQMLGVADEFILTDSLHEAIRFMGSRSTVVDIA